MKSQKVLKMSYFGANTRTRRFNHSSVEMTITLCFNRPHPRRRSDAASVHRRQSVLSSGLAAALLPKFWPVRSGLLWPQPTRRTSWKL